MTVYHKCDMCGKATRVPSCSWLKVTRICKDLEFCPECADKILQSIDAMRKAHGAIMP